MTLGDRVASRWCLLLLEVATFLDGLVVVSVEARKKLVRCSGEELYEGHCARPARAMKSDSSRVRREGRQVVRPGPMPPTQPRGAGAVGQRPREQAAHDGTPLSPVQ